MRKCLQAGSECACACVYTCAHLGPEEVMPPVAHNSGTQVRWRVVSMVLDPESPDLVPERGSHPRS